MRPRPTRTGKNNPDPIARGKAKQVETYEDSDELAMPPGTPGAGETFVPGKRVPAKKKKMKKPMTRDAKIRSFAGM